MILAAKEVSNQLISSFCYSLFMYSVFQCICVGTKYTFAIIGIRLNCFMYFTQTCIHLWFFTRIKILYCMQLVAWKNWEGLRGEYGQKPYNIAVKTIPISHYLTQEINTCMYMYLIDMLLLYYTIANTLPNQRSHNELPLAWIMRQITCTGIACAHRN